MDAPMVVNPYYLLPFVSGTAKTVLPESTFTPIVADQIDIVNITKEVDIDKYVSNYKAAIRDGDLAAATEALKKLFLQRHYLFKALVESVVAYIGIGNLKLTELIFSLVAHDISGLEAVLVTQLMARDPARQELLKFYIESQIEEVEKVRKPTKKSKRAEEIIGTMMGEHSLDVLLERPDIAKATAKHYYESLSNADSLYHTFVFQVADIPPTELVKNRKDVIKLTKGTNADRKLGHALEGGYFV
jgi:hypothetical protein